MTLKTGQGIRVKKQFGQARVGTEGGILEVFSDGAVEISLQYHKFFSGTSACSHKVTREEFEEYFELTGSQFQPVLPAIVWT